MKTFSLSLFAIITAFMFSALSSKAESCNIMVTLDPYSFSADSLNKALNIRGYHVVNEVSAPSYLAKETCVTRFHDCSAQELMPRCSGDSYYDRLGIHTGISTSGSFESLGSGCLSRGASCQPYTSVDYCELEIKKVSTGETISKFEVGGGTLGFLGGWRKYKMIPACESMSAAQ